MWSGEHTPDFVIEIPAKLEGEVQQFLGLMGQASQNMRRESPNGKALYFWHSMQLDPRRFRKLPKSPSR